MKAKEFIPAEKPRNFVAKNAKMGGAGAHKDKKKAEKQGDLKHKSKQFEQGVAEGFNSELKRIQSDVWDFYKDVHNVRPRHWTQEQWNDENFLRLQMKQLSDIVNKMSPEEKAEQGWS